MTAELMLLPGVFHRGREITAPRLCGLLALLAADLRNGCSTGRLMDGLWPDERPEHPTKALQMLVSRARAQLGPDVVDTTPTGYRLALRDEEVDAAAVLLSASATARHTRAGEHAAALASAEQGLALWPGGPGAGAARDGGVPDDPVAVLRADRAGAYRSLVRFRALALSRLGRSAEAVEPLGDVARQRPRDEEVLLELLRCEAATAGPSAALVRYEAYRRSLRDELGTDPGSALQAVYQELLRGQPPVARNGVPSEPNPLLGRADDIAAVAELVRTCRVTSIVGTGGLGKTRLAYAVSRRADQRVVQVVALAGVRSDDDVTGEVAAVLGVGESLPVTGGRLAARPDVLTAVADALGPGPVLLVLDNCEHVVGGVAELVRVLVARTEELRVLVTSRAPLDLSSESVYLLPELDPATTVELFGQRARAARPGVDLPAEAVEELCRHLDGLPLAVELAAARVRVMSVTEIVRRIDDRFAVLRSGARDTPQRHRTMHAVIDWSWHLLDPAGQAAMRALSIFPDGFTADAAGHLLAGDLGPGDIWHILELLVDQSLLKVAETASGTRFRMLETVREFGAARREDAGETGLATDRFLAWARDFGVTHHASMLGADLGASLEQIRAEQENLVQALRHGLDRRDGATVAATAAVLSGLWIVDSNFTRVATSLGEIVWVLSHYRPEPAFVEATRTAAVLCAVSGLVVRDLGGPARSLVALRRLPPAPPDTPVRAIQIVLGALAESSGSDLTALRELCDRAEPLVAGMANAAASYRWEYANDLDGALKAAGRTLAAFENQEIPWLRAVAHSRIGELRLEAGPADEAVRHLGAALSAVEESGAWSSANRLRWVLVLANLQRGAVDEAERWLERAVQDGGEESAGLSMFDVAVRAEIALGRGDVDAGLRLWRRAADGLRRTERPAVDGDLSGLTPWALEVQAIAVATHTYHGRLDLVEELAGALPRTLSAMTTKPGDANIPVCGALLLAIAVADIDRGNHTGDAHAMRSGARMTALAERFGFPRGFQPAMSATRARRVAEEADRSAYADAVSSYADLDREGLRAAVSAALLARGQLTGSDPA
ncbi:ATP-binding protein [Dactylosporangium roseum]|nr:BTAD domain-containing putative transcriptional regulator [Dactylosporangium roseum]